MEIQSISKNQYYRGQFLKQVNATSSFVFENEMKIFITGSRGLIFMTNLAIKSESYANMTACTLFIICLALK